MEIKVFARKLEKEFGPCVRQIHYKLVNDKKDSIVNEKKNMTQKEIKSSRGGWSEETDSINCYSIATRYLKDIYVVDFDSKCEKAMKSKLMEVLKFTKCYGTETAHGFHYYVKLPDLPYNIDTHTYHSTDICEGGHFPLDLLKNNNTWENNDRVVFGDNFKEFKWFGYFEKYFNIPKMNLRDNSLPTAIISTGGLEEDQIELSPTEIQTCPLEQFQGYIDRLGPHRYGYETWLKVGIICYNNFEGSTVGFNIWNAWSSNDPSGGSSVVELATKWDSFSSEDSNPITYGTLRYWANIDSPCNEYEEVYKEGGGDALVDYINESLGYCIATSEFIHILKENWYPKKKAEMDLYFSKYEFADPNDPKGEGSIQPFKWWLKHSNQGRYDKIVFDPKETPRSECCYNLWTRYDINSTDCQEADIGNCDKILQHIYKIWTKGSDIQYDYILDWFASKLQFPWKKLCSVPVLQSQEGAGKNIILDLFIYIMGSKYYTAVSSPQHILGSFNGMVEGKLLVDLNEVSFGGNVVANNQLKSLITEPKTMINKKNKEAYEIDNFCDYIITTNEKWVISSNPDSRRYNCFDMDNWLAQCSPEERTLYNTELLEQTQNEPGIKAFAKFLYNRDISSFNPRNFEKGKMFVKQVEMSWDGIMKWIHSALENDMVNRDPLTPWNSHMPRVDGAKDIGVKIRGKFYYYKQDLYDLYTKTEQGTYAKNSSLIEFYNTLEDIFKDNYKENKLKGRMVVSIPNIEIARQCFRDNQQCQDYFCPDRIPEIECEDDEIYGLWDD